MTLERGARLGPYEITTILGTGGMGEVYRARDSRLDRDVAIKVLRSSRSADPEQLRRFAREAQVAGSLNHPNILAVFDVGTHDGVTYLVTELLEGSTLRTRLESGPLPLARAIELARQTCAGLAAAHGKGITHRDIKPENLFVTTDGRIKILDFGLAKQRVGVETDETRTLTAEGVVMGTPGYMSPEQVRGLRIDARSDIFSIGSVLYETIGGERAFGGDSAVQTMNAILSAEPPELPADTLRSAPALGRILKRCLEKDPAERFHSAHDLGLALESVAAVSGPAPGIVSPTARSRRLTLPGIAAWLVVIAVAATIGAALQQRLTAPPSTGPVFMRSLTSSGHDGSPAASPDGKTVAFASARDGVPRIWLKQVAGGGEIALTDGPDDYPRFSADGSSILFIRTTPESPSLYRVPALGGVPRKLLDDVGGADWSPDGRQLAFTRWVSGERSGSIVGVAAADGSGAREIAFVAGRALIAPRWSPDGRTIAAVTGLANVAAGLGIDLVNVSGSGSHLLAAARPGMMQSSVLWSSDSRSVIYSEAESIAAWLTGSSARIIRQDVATGQAVTLSWMGSHSRTLDVLGPGHLLMDTRSSRENLRELSSGDRDSAARWLTRANSTDRQPTYSPDGQWVAFSSNRGGDLDLWAVNRVDGGVRRLTDDPGEDWDVSFSPDGRRLLWASNRTGPYEIWAANADGSEARQLSHDGYFAQNPQQSPDGRWVVYASTHPEHPGLWRMEADGRDPVRFVEGAVQNPEISPDGRVVLFVDGLAGRIRVVGLQDGAVVPFEIGIERHRNTTAVLGRARWMPDGRAIAFIGQDERGVNGVFVQDFAPGRDTSATRRALGGFDPENSAESFGISPDGRLLTIGVYEQMFNVMGASNVPGIEPKAGPGSS